MPVPVFVHQKIEFVPIMTILQLIPIHIASPINENSNLLMEALMERDDIQLIHKSASMNVYIVADIVFQ